MVPSYSSNSVSGIVTESPFDDDGVVVDVDVDAAATAAVVAVLELALLARAPPTTVRFCAYFDKRNSLKKKKIQKSPQTCALVRGAAPQRDDSLSAPAPPAVVAVAAPLPLPFVIVAGAVVVVIEVLVRGECAWLLLWLLAPLAAAVVGFDGAAEAPGIGGNASSSGSVGGNAGTDSSTTSRPRLFIILSSSANAIVSAADTVGFAPSSARAASVGDGAALVGIGAIFAVVVVVVVVLEPFVAVVLFGATPAPAPPTAGRAAGVGVVRAGSVRLAGALLVDVRAPTVGLLGVLGVVDAGFGVMPVVVVVVVFAAAVVVVVVAGFERGDWPILSTNESISAKSAACSCCSRCDELAIATIRIETTHRMQKKKKKKKKQPRSKLGTHQQKKYPIRRN
jgi:hypothetical protein